MKFKSIALILSMVFVLFSTSVFAASRYDHVSVAPNAKGDLLVYPVFISSNGWETKLTVVNTSTTQCVVAKIIFRSAERSAELRDFLLYLSPTDVWTGTIYSIMAETTHDASGSVAWGRIKSTDSSCINQNNVKASVEDPLDLPFEETCISAASNMYVDRNDMGYVEVVEVCSFFPVPETPGMDITLVDEILERVVEKDFIRTVYNVWGASIGGAFYTDFNVEYDGNVKTFQMQYPKNVLTGALDIYNQNDDRSFGIKPVVFKDYDLKIFEGLGNTSTIGTPGSDNSVVEVEAAIAKNNIAVPYYADPKGWFISMFTFPTKQTDWCRTSNNITGQFSGFPSPVFGLVGYDLDEHKVPLNFSPVRALAFTGELNFINSREFDIPGGFEEGWFNLVFTAGATGSFTRNNFYLTYTGAPVIASTMRMMNLGDAERQYGGWYYNAYTDGTVAINDTRIGLAGTPGPDNVTSVFDHNIVLDPRVPTNPTGEYANLTQDEYDAIYYNLATAWYGSTNVPGYQYGCPYNEYNTNTSFAYGSLAIDAHDHND